VKPLLPVLAKWVRGEMGLPIVPFPRCWYGQKKKSLKLTINQVKEEYLPVEALPVPDESPLKATFVFSRALHLTPIGTIIPEDCDLLTACLFPESVYPHQATEPTSVSSQASTTTDELIQPSDQFV